MSIATGWCLLTFTPAFGVEANDVDVEMPGDCPGETLLESCPNAKAGSLIYYHGVIDILKDGWEPVGVVPNIRSGHRLLYSFKKQIHYFPAC